MNLQVWINPKKRLIITLLCVYNAIAFLISCMVEADEFKTFLFEKALPAWHYWLLIILPLIVQFVSTIGIWYEKKWAFICQIFFYLPQSVSYQDPEMTYSYFLGPHFFVNWTLDFPDGAVVQGFNLVAIAILLLLVIWPFAHFRG